MPKTIKSYTETKIYAIVHASTNIEIDYIIDGRTNIELCHTLASYCTNRFLCE